jgi:DNA-binding MarR family transcriptional regulator
VSDSSADADWLTVTALAAARGVDKSAMSRRIARLEAQGLLAARKAGKAKLINVLQFDEAVAATRDAIREMNGRGGALEPGAEDRDPVLAQEQARRVRIQADIAQIELDRARGTLIEVDDAQDAMARAAGRLVRGLETLPTRVEEWAAALAQGGVQAMRAAIRETVRDLRERLAAEMTLLASEAEPADE